MKIITLMILFFFGSEALAQGADKILEQKAKAGDAQAQYELGNMYLQGRIRASPTGQSLNFSRMYAFAYVWLKSAADNGNQSAQLLLESESSLKNIHPEHIAYAIVSLDYYEFSNVNEQVSERPTQSTPSTPISAYNSPNEEVVKAAFGFMQFGDTGWKTSGVTGPTINGCLVSFRQYLLVDYVDLKVDLNLANWSSARTWARFDGKVEFSVNGQEGFLVMSMSNPTNGLVLLANGIALGSRSFMSFTLQTTEQRFENALRDLINECPGYSSRY